MGAWFSSSASFCSWGASVDVFDTASRHIQRFRLTLSDKTVKLSVRQDKRNVLVDFAFSFLFDRDVVRDCDLK